MAKFLEMIEKTTNVNQLDALGPGLSALAGKPDGCPEGIRAGCDRRAQMLGRAMAFRVTAWHNQPVHSWMAYP